MSERPILTPRQTQVLQALADGMSQAEIATAWNYAIGTVKYHLEMARDRLGEKSSMSAVLRAVALGLVTIDGDRYIASKPQPCRACDGTGVVEP